MQVKFRTLLLPFACCLCTLSPAACSRGAALPSGPPQITLRAADGAQPAFVEVTGLAAADLSTSARRSVHSRAVAIAAHRHGALDDPARRRAPGRSPPARAGALRRVAVGYHVHAAVPVRSGPCVRGHLPPVEDAACRPIAAGDGDRPASGRSGQPVDDRHRGLPVGRAVAGEHAAPLPRILGADGQRRRARFRAADR